MEASLRAAAFSFINNGNRVGWTESIWQMAQLAQERNRPAQALALLEHASRKLEQDRDPDAFIKQKGRTALRIARVHWEQGQLTEAHHWRDVALKQLQENLSNDRAEASSLREFTASLIA